MLGLAIMIGMPRLTTVVLAPLVSVIVVTVLVVIVAISVPNVGDQGELPESLPSLLWPDVPLTLETLGIILPFSIAMAVVGILESLLTAKLVDDITDTPSSKTREAYGQGAANILSGFFAGVFVLALVLLLGDIVAIIPMAALVAVMIMVAIATFDWHSI